MQSELIAEGGMGMFFVLNQFQLQYIFNAFFVRGEIHIYN